MTTPIHHYTLQEHLNYKHLPIHIQMAKHNTDFHLHGHDFSELIIVLSGETRHIVSCHELPLKRGDVFVVHPGVKHQFIGSSHLRLLNIMFTLEKPLFDLEALGQLPGFHLFFSLDPLLRKAGGENTGLSLKEDVWDSVTALAHKMLQEYSRGEEGFEAMITALFQELVITLSRNKYSGPVNNSSEISPLAKAFVFIQDNYRNKLSVGDIAESACITPRHLNRLFNNLLNTSPIEYVTDLRLQEARRLLREEARITETAEHCGFSDSNYFSRIFRSRYGMSPREYRKSPRI